MPFKIPLEKRKKKNRIYCQASFHTRNLSSLQSKLHLCFKFVSSLLESLIYPKNFNSMFVSHLLPDRDQSRDVVWLRSASRGHCERLAAQAGGRAIDHLPPEPDPIANAPIWSNHGSPRTPADHLSPGRDGRTQAHTQTHTVKHGIERSEETDQRKYPKLPMVWNSFKLKPENSVQWCPLPNVSLLVKQEASSQRSGPEFISVRI